MLTIVVGRMPFTIVVNMGIRSLINDNASSILGIWHHKQKSTIHLGRLFWRLAGWRGYGECFGVNKSNGRMDYANLRCVSIHSNRQCSTRCLFILHPPLCRVCWCHEHSWSSREHNGWAESPYLLILFGYQDICICHWCFQKSLASSILLLLLFEEHRLTVEVAVDRRHLPNMMLK